MTYRNVKVFSNLTTLRGYAGGPYCFNQSNSYLAYKHDYINSSNSPRDQKGNLLLRENSLQRVLIDSKPGRIEYSIEGVKCSDTFTAAFPMPDNGIFPVSQYSDLREKAQTIAIQKHYEKISSVKVNLAEAFSTRKQAYDLIATTFVKMASWVRSIRRGRNPWKGTRCDSRDLAGVWLSGVYGWSPLLGDLYTLFGPELLDPPPILLSTSHRIQVPVQELYTGDYLVIPGTDCEIFTHLDGFLSVKAKVKSWIEILNLEQTYAKHLGLQDPALLLWELMPYSFVIDWALPIGAWLEAQTALNGLRVVDASLTTGVKSTYIMSPVTTSSILSQQVTAGGVKIHKALEIERTTGMPELRFPYIKNPFSPQHAINAIALFTELITRPIGRDL